MHAWAGHSGMQKTMGSARRSWRHHWYKAFQGEHVQTGLVSLRGSTEKERKSLAYMPVHRGESNHIAGISSCSQLTRAATYTAPRYIPTYNSLTVLFLVCSPLHYFSLRSLLPAWHFLFGDGESVPMMIAEMVIAPKMETNSFLEVLGCQSRNSTGPLSTGALSPLIHALRFMA
jgi:hypothetical protein